MAQLQGYSIDGLRRARASLPEDSPSDDPELREAYRAFRQYILMKIDERIATLEAQAEKP